MKSKKIFLIFIIIFIGTTVIAQSNYSKGFQDGYKIGYCYGEYACIPPIPPITPILRIGESDDSYQDGYNRGFKLGLEDKQKNNTSQPISTPQNQDERRYFENTTPTIPNNFAYKMPIELMMQATETARQRYEVERQRHERNEQIQREKAINLMNQVKSYYNQLPAYPENVKDGWHKVISMNNYDFCEERKVYVENNKITKYIIDDCINRKILYSTSINNAKAILHLVNNNGSMIDYSMVEIYFIEYINNPMSNTTPPIQSGKISFWTNWKKSGNLSLFFDGMYAGTFTTYFKDGKLNCGQDGTITIEYKPGTYRYVAVSPNRKYEGTVTIVPGQCYLYLLKK